MNVDNTANDHHQQALQEYKVSPAHYHAPKNNNEDGDLFFKQLRIFFNPFLQLCVFCSCCSSTAITRRDSIRIVLFHPVKPGIYPIFWIPFFGSVISHKSLPVLCFSHCTRS